MEDFNTSTLPHRKYYNLEFYHQEKAARARKKGHSMVRSGDEAAIGVVPGQSTDAFTRAVDSVGSQVCGQCLLQLVFSPASSSPSGFGGAHASLVPACHS